MAIAGKTLKELNVQPGDVVTYCDQGSYTIKIIDGELVAVNEKLGMGSQKVQNSTDPRWKIVFRASSKDSAQPVLWKDMTPEQKGALLLAHHEGKTIEYSRETRPSLWHTLKQGVRPVWSDDKRYRVKPEPKVETVTMNYQKGQNSIGVNTHKDDTHRITFKLIDGEPDVTSIEMQRI